MAVIGILLVSYFFVLKKKSKLKDIVVDDIDITLEEKNTTVYKSRVNSSTTPLYNDSGDNYEMNNNEVLDWL